MATEQLTAEQIDRLLDEHDEALVKEEKKVTLSDVIRSGGIRAAAGPIQKFYQIAELSGNLPKGAMTTEEFTRNVLEYENIGDLNTAETFLRDSIANILPITAEIYLTRGRSMLQSLKPSAGTAAVGGFLSFNENPREALSPSATLWNTVISGLSAPMGNLALMGMGRGLSSLMTGAPGARSVANIFRRPGEEVRTQGAELIEQAAERGVTLTPGAATQDPALLRAEETLEPFVSETFARRVADAIGSNATSINALIDDLYNTILPEGKDEIKRAIADAYARVDQQAIPQERLKTWDTLSSEPVVQEAIQTIRRTSGLSSFYRGLTDAQGQPTVGRIKLVIDQLESQIKKTQGTPAAQVYIAAKKRLEAFADDVSPSYKEARAVTMREKTANTVLEALRKGGSSKVVPLEFQAQAFVNAFQNLDAKESLDFAIENLPTSKAQKEARAKFNLLIELIPRAAETEKILSSALGKTDRLVAERAGPTPAGLYTLTNFLRLNNDRAFIDFILDPSKSSQRLRDNMPRPTTNAEEAGRMLSILIREILPLKYDEGLAPNMSTPEEDMNLNKVSASSKSKTYQRLLRSGKLEELKEKNPRVYQQLLDSTGQVAIA
jgi:hypothetical protein